MYVILVIHVKVIRILMLYTSYLYEFSPSIIKLQSTSS